MAIEIPGVRLARKCVRCGLISSGRFAGLWQPGLRVLRVRRGWPEAMRESRSVFAGQKWKSESERGPGAPGTPWD
jgi:hypothetical protein